MQITNTNNIHDSDNSVHIQSVDNLFFFKPEATQVSYMGNFLFEDVIQKDVKLNINKITEPNNGIIYELKVKKIRYEYQTSNN